MNITHHRETIEARARHDTLVEFLAVLAGDAEPGQFLELRYRLDDGVRMGQVFEPVHRLHGLATRALALGRRTDVYVGCAPRTRRFGGRDAIDGGFVLWADCDGSDAVRALEGFDPRPAIVVASGTGDNRHAYWRLTEPLARHELERANCRLAHALGADPASADAARILRPPGTSSHKRLPAVPVEAIQFDPVRRIAGRDVVGGLPDPPRAAPRWDGIARTERRGDDPLLDIPPPVYVERLLGVEVPRHRKVPCPFHPDTQPSLHVYDTPERGWYCFGRCRRGGTIYDLAAPLYGYDTRGDGFLRLKAELRRLFALQEA
jgi:hypothetical protein